MKRNIISILLAIALVVGLLPVTVLAAESYTYPTSEPTPTWTGSGTAEDPYVIDTAQELADLAWLINNNKTNYKSASYKLSGNIDLSGGTWTPIGGDGWNRTFTGTFDGGSFTVSGLNAVNIVNSMKYVALFGQTEGATVKNLTVSGTYTTDAAYAAGICAYAKNTAFVSCTSQVNITGTGAVTHYFGGIAGYSDGTTTFTGCTNSGNLSYTGTKTGYTGGICGRITSGAEISACGNTGSITGKSSSSQGTGGIVGFVDMASGSGTATKITGCTNAGTVSGTYNVGGIAGYSKNTELTIDRCANSGTVAGANENVGGICGFRKNPITGCSNSGNVTGSKYVGGISGKISGSNDAITLCSNSGSIKGTYASTYLNSVYVGGIEGYTYGASGNTGKLIENCYNTGVVAGATDSSDYIGGISGNMSNGTIANCHNYAALSFADENYSGAIAYTSATVTNCYYLTGTDTHGTQKTAAEFADGTVGKLLQEGNTDEVWGQNVGTDLYPVFFNGSNSLLTKPVYAAFASLCLEGRIEVNFYMHLDESVAADSTGFMRFTVGENAPVDIPVTQADVQTVKGQTCYVFTASVAAKEMTDTIRGQYFYGESSSDVYEYSVRQYAHTLMEKAAGDEVLAEFVPLAKAMLNYGAAAQMSFNHNTGDLANKDLSAEDKILADVDASAYAHVISGSEDGIRADSITLVLESETTVRVFFVLEGEKTIDGYAFTVNGRNVQPRYRDGNVYFVEISNIAAQDLDDIYNVTVGGLSVSYGGLSYVNQTNNLADATDQQKNLVKALFAYWNAAENYFN